MNNQLKGLLITTLGVLFVVPDSLFIRLLDAEPLVTAYWRSMTVGVFVLIWVLVTQGIKGFGPVMRTGRAGLLYVVALGAMAPAFVMAIANTSVANVVFILAAIPVFSLLFSRLFLGEPISKRMVMTMAAVGAGLAIIAYGSGSSEIASWKGDLWALYAAGMFAVALTAARKMREVSMVPAIPMASICAALLIGLFVDPFPAFKTQYILFLGHGAFIAIASCLMMLGPRYITSAEVSLLILLESVLAPILVWYVIGEYPGELTLIGGAVVIGALLVSNFVVLMRQRKNRNG